MYFILFSSLFLQLIDTIFFLYPLKEYTFSSILFFAFFTTFNVVLFPYPKVYTSKKFLLFLLLYSFLLLYFHTLHSTVSLFCKIISYVRFFLVKGMQYCLLPLYYFFSLVSRISICYFLILPRLL